MYLRRRAVEAAELMDDTVLPACFSMGPNLPYTANETPVHSRARQETRRDHQPRKRGRFRAVSTLALETAFHDVINCRRKSC